jgi:hypothetical protein
MCARACKGKLSSAESGDRYAPCVQVAYVTTRDVVSLPIAA